MADKIYCGSGKEKFNGDMISIAFCLDDYPEEYIFTSDKSGKRYLKMNVCKKRDGEDQYGKTHYITVDTFKPDPNRQQSAPQQQNQQPSYQQPDFEDDIPF